MADRDLIEEAIDACRTIERERGPHARKGLPNDIARAQGETWVAKQIREILERHGRPGAGDAAEYTLMGVPITEVTHVTLDGRHWLEVFGTIYVSGLDQPDPFEGPALIFRVAQAPGGKDATFGLEPGAAVVTAPHRVIGVVRKAQS